ncbi:MAG: S8 family serine peptidase [Hoeflea sp.]|uniref:S8 family serine peptidase n=1 Tax=Hoeflea sp. TaxID=1940281 RepID=UPI003EF29D76
MSRIRSTAFGYSLLLVSTLAAPAQSLPPSSELSPELSIVTRVPSGEVSRALEALPQTGLADWSKQAVDLREIKPDTGNLDDVGRGKLEMNASQSATVPFVAPNTMIIQFKTETTAAEIEDYFKFKDLPVIQTFPSIGAVQVEADLSSYFTPQLTDRSVNETILRGVTSAIADFQTDTRIQSATPDIVLTDKAHHGGANTDTGADITNVLHPTGIVSGFGESGDQEVTDWGVIDIEADKLWGMPGATDGVVFGVMDAGFSRHDDLVFVGFPSGMGANNHGNHVGGIACAAHNGRGIAGVLQNCFIRARSADVFFETMEAIPELRFVVLFSQILRTLDRFVTEQNDVSTFNVSLGYNWRSNFGINPDLPESEQWRVLVASQGAILVTLLEIANTKNKVIYSAAGNDSTGLSMPIKAKYASPFNWAAVTARELGIASNGIIVGAHGPDGKRAPFSNSGAQISCPGVNILSALSFDANKQPSTTAYGQMSGTSMASPYCASAHVLFHLVRPGYTGVEITRCLMAADDVTDDGTPRLRLTQSLTACPARG